MTERRAAVVLVVALALSFCLAGCSKDRDAPKKSVRVRSAEQQPPPAPVERGPFRFPEPERLVAIGDVHGDLVATRAALQLAGATDDADRWIGGELVVVQTGDQLDRGDDERAIVDLFERLAEQAKQAGGAVHALNGNHETMNVAGDFRYVTPGGFADFAAFSADGLPERQLEQLPPRARGRAAAFMPGGPYARKLADRRVVVIVGDSVFVHGGVEPDYVRYGIERINRETRRWMTAQTALPPKPIADPQGPVWSRRYSDGFRGADCRALAAALAGLGAERMVVGHTPQKTGITSACDGRVWRIDVGMAAHYGGRVEVLEIRGDQVRPLRAR